MSSILKPVLGSQIQYGHPLARGLVGCWLMNEGAGNIVHDLSWNNITGTFSGSGVVWVAGKFGSAIDGDATDYVNCGSPNILKGQGQCTILAWLDVPSAIVTGSDYPFFWYGNGPDIGYIGTNTTEHAVFALCDSTNTAHMAQDTSDPFLSNPGCHQVVGTYDGTTVKVYFDARLGDTTAAMSGAIQSTPAMNMELCRAIDRTEFVMIWHRALTASEVAQLYREPFCMFKRSPIELWTGAMGGEEPLVYDSIFMSCNF